MTQQHICPWWMGYLLASPIRKFGQNPTKILSPYIKDGMTVLEIGSGMGFFTLPIARLVGEKGHVVAVDIQEKMINSLRKRATRAGLSERVETRICTEDSLCVDDLASKIDFALTFAVLHETSDIKRVLTEVYNTLKAGGLLLISEPVGHVNNDEFAETIGIARSIGYEIVSTPKVRSSHSVLMMKQALPAGIL